MNTWPSIGKGTYVQTYSIINNYGYKSIAGSFAHVLESSVEVIALQFLQYKFKKVVSGERHQKF